MVKLTDEVNSYGDVKKNLRERVESLEECISDLEKRCGVLKKNINQNVNLTSTYEDAKKAVRENGSASISWIQRKFYIGYNRAAKLMDRLEKDGIISPANGSKPRKVLK